MGILRTTSTPEFISTGLLAALSEGFQLQVDLLEEDILRIALVPSEGLTVDRTWMIAPEGETPWGGRQRLSTDGFSCPAVSSSSTGFEGQNLAVKIEGNPLRLTVLQKVEGVWQILFEDRPEGAYQWFEKSNRLKHFQRRGKQEAHYGLGDKSGKLDRTGRRLRCLQSDALGYDAERSDPLYKHAPWLIASSETGSGGLLYDTMAETVFDLGAEHSNYFPLFRHVEMSEKGMVLYVLAGPTIRDVVPNLHRLTGPVAFPPRWSLGFAFTTMHHADAPNAQQVILDFAKQARARKLPISAIHSGSGYTAGKDGLRYVFNWNTDRFPDKAAFFSQLDEMGFRTCANIKPVLLTGHHAFDQARTEGWFVRRADGDAAIEMFWGGQGASLDFTNRVTIQWWQDGVSQQVLGAGFDAVWNDNNECELWDETAHLSGFDHTLPAMECRPVHALLMTRASYEATKAKIPNERPYTISRAGPIGISRYGETWSGDNETSWHTLKWNLRQGLSMSLSGFPLVGHDIGGFAGPPPEPELLVRWFQMMIFHPRCVMNSWKVDFDNIPNLPWMHEEVFEEIKAALELRYRFMPHLYNQIRKTHKTGHPVIAPTFYHFDDLECKKDADTFMVGERVLVAPIVEEGGRSVNLYLPHCPEGWVNYDTDELLSGGQWVVQEAPLGQLPIFVRGGSVLPLATKWDLNTPHDAQAISLSGFIGQGSGESSGTFWWDDGVSWPDENEQENQFEYKFTWSEADEANLEFGGGEPPDWPTITAKII